MKWTRVKCFAAFAATLCAAATVAHAQTPPAPPTVPPTQPAETAPATPPAAPAGPAGAQPDAPTPFAGVEPIPDSDLATWRTTSASLLRKARVLAVLLGAVSREGGNAVARVNAIRAETQRRAAALRARATSLVGAAQVAQMGASGLSGAASGVSQIAAVAPTQGQQLVGNIFAGFLDGLAASSAKAAAKKREEAQHLLAEASDIEGKLGEIQQNAEALARDNQEKLQRLAARRDYLKLLGRVMRLTAKSEDLRREVAAIAERLPAIDAAVKQVVAAPAAKAP
jgi:hypothetical protein